MGPLTVEEFLLPNTSVCPEVVYLLGAWMVSPGLQEEGWNPDNVASVTRQPECRWPPSVSRPPSF